MDIVGVLVLPQKQKVERPLSGLLSTNVFGARNDGEVTAVKPASDSAAGLGVTMLLSFIGAVSSWKAGDYIVGKVKGYRENKIKIKEDLHAQRIQQEKLNFHKDDVREPNAAAFIGRPFRPSAPVSISNSHSINTITPSTRFGGGSRASGKTVARGDIDFESDKLEINSGKARQLENGDILTSSGRIYGTHPDSQTIFPRSGPGMVQLSQAEFDLLRTMTKSGGMKGSAQLQLTGLLRSGNPGVTASTRQLLIDLFKTRQ